MELKEIIERLEKVEDIYILVNARPNVPYIECDTDDTMLDYISVYFVEDYAKERAKELTNDGYGAKVVMTVHKDRFLAFFSDVIYFGIDAIKFINETSSCIIETDKIVKLDMNAKDSNGNPFVYNPSAQISMFYLMQETQKKKELRSEEALMEMQNEVLANIANATFYVAFTELKQGEGAPEAEPGEKRFVPAVMTDPKGGYHLPLFTDMNELKRSFQGGEKTNIPFKAMPYREIMERLLPDQSNIQGIIINPRGVQLPFEKTLAKRLAKDPNFMKN